MPADDKVPCDDAAEAAVPAADVVEAEYVFKLPMLFEIELVTSNPM
jgi:hypothetical protein